VCSGGVAAVRWRKHKRDPERRHQAA